MARLSRAKWWTVFAAIVLGAAGIALVVGSPDDQAASPTSMQPTSSSSSSVTTTTSEPPTTVTAVPRTSTTRSPATTQATTVPRTTSTVAPSSTAVVVRRGDPSRLRTALTFDAGSDAGFTAAILDTLRRNGIRATFGITGRWAEANPSLLGRIAAEGHQIVNHSYDHPSFTGRSTGTAPLSRAARLDQLARADAAIVSATGASSKPWFRPPYGDEDASVRADVGSVGYRYELMWTVDSLGWKGIGADQIVERCLAQAVPGAIYLFHVGSASADHAALQRVIDGLRAQGYAFVTASALISG